MPPADTTSTTTGSVSPADTTTTTTNTYVPPADTSTSTNTTNTTTTGSVSPADTNTYVPPADTTGTTTTGSVSPADITTPNVPNIDTTGLDTGPVIPYNNVDWIVDTVNGWQYPYDKTTGATLGDKITYTGTAGVGTPYVPPADTTTTNTNTTGSSISPDAGSATKSDNGSVYQTPGAFGDTIPSNITDNMAPGSTVVKNSDGTYTGIDTAGNITKYNSDGSVFNPRVDVTYVDPTTGELVTTKTNTDTSTTIGGLLGTGASSPNATTSPFAGTGSTASVNDFIKSNYGLIGTGGVATLDANGNPIVDMNKVVWQVDPVTNTTTATLPNGATVTTNNTTGAVISSTNPTVTTTPVAPTTETTPTTTETQTTTTSTTAGGGGALITCLC